MLTQIQLLQIKNAAVRILHVPGNYSGGNLEMAVVADYHMPYEELKERCAQIAGALKQTDEVFRNVRVNLIKWVSDECIIKEISSLSMFQMGRAFEDYEEYHKPLSGREDNEKKSADEEKSVDELFRQLKLFYARSKIILIITDGSFKVVEEEKVREYLNPFLKRKLLTVQPPEKIKYGICVEVKENSV